MTDVSEYRSKIGAESPSYCLAGMYGNRVVVDLWRGSPGGSVVKNPSAMQELMERQVPSLGQEDPLE